MICILTNLPEYFVFLYAITITLIVLYIRYLNGKIHSLQDKLNSKNKNNQGTGKKSRMMQDIKKLQRTRYEKND